MKPENFPKVLLISISRLRFIVLNVNNAYHQQLFLYHYQRTIEENRNQLQNKLILPNYQQINWYSQMNHFFWMFIFVLSQPDALEIICH